MSNTLKGGYKRGDHLFNHGLTKLGLDEPTNLVLLSSLRELQHGLHCIEREGGFNLVVNKGNHAADENSQLFGETVRDLRIAWSQLDILLSSSGAKTQHRAQVIRRLEETLEQLRLNSFDPDAAELLRKESSHTERRVLDEKIARVKNELQELLGAFLGQILRFMPTSSAVGQSKNHY